MACPSRLGRSGVRAQPSRQRAQADVGLPRARGASQLPGLLCCRMGQPLSFWKRRAGIFGLWLENTAESQSQLFTSDSYANENP